MKAARASQRRRHLISPTHADRVRAIDFADAHRHFVAALDAGSSRYRIMVARPPAAMPGVRDDAAMVCIHPDYARHRQLAIRRQRKPLAL